MQEEPKILGVYKRHTSMKLEDYATHLHNPNKVIPYESDVPNLSVEVVGMDLHGLVFTARYDYKNCAWCIPKQWIGKEWVWFYNPVNVDLAKKDHRCLFNK